MSEKRGYSPEEAADYLGIAVSKIRARIRDRVIPTRKDGRDVLIERADLDAYFDGLPSERAS